MRAISAFFLNPFTSAWERRQLVRELARREVHATFTGSILGVGWLVLQPLLSLTVYALVFGGILNLRGGGGGGLGFVSALFTGMIVYQAFTESVSRASRLVLSRPNYVTKVTFPLYLLPWPVAVLAAVHTACSTVLLILLHLLFVGDISWTAILLPAVLAPVLLLGLGVSWILASLGVYVRDTADITRVILQLLFFLSPIVWSLDRVTDPAMQTIVLLNPLAVAMETSRALITGGPGPGTGWVIGFFVVAWLVAAAGHAFFRRTQDGFADVL